MYDHILFTPKKLQTKDLNIDYIHPKQSFNLKFIDGKINEKQITKHTIIFPFYNNKLFISPKLVKLVAKKKAAFEIPLRPLLFLPNNDTQYYLYSLKRLLKWCVKYSSLYLLSSRATNIYELKTSQDLISFGICLGLTPDQAKSALQEYYEVVMR